jgi:signal transduction histidine kinase
VVAVSFAPLHVALRRAVTRLVYGQWSEPAEVLATTGRRLQDASDAPALLGNLVEEIATGLDLDAVWITDERRHVMARHGVPGDATDSAALTAYGLPVGRLHWRGDPPREAQRLLLADLAGQIGAVVHGAGLVESLRGARERLVLAREEERRRLRRDLHDGLGPELAALTMQVDALRNRAGASAVDLDAELVRLRSGLQASVQAVRRVVEGLRPPALDELGLAGALEELVDGLAGGPAITVDVEEVPGLGAATEVAVYRVAQEALTNVVRHSRAERASVSLRTDRATLVLTVRDEGVGGVAPREGGVGLGSMTDRAEEVGGRLEVHHGDGAGTCVMLTVPLVTEALTREEAS